jgi:hypothetical protein
LVTRPRVYSSGPGALCPCAADGIAIAADGIAPAVSLVPKMTDGDLGITKAWAHQAPPDTVYVTETRWRYIPPKSSPSRWLADLGVALRWGAALIALAILLVVAFDYRSAHDGPSEQ